jgi:DNA-binding CsgD family transcriptional regulator
MKKPTGKGRSGPNGDKPEVSDKERIAYLEGRLSALESFVQAGLIGGQTQQRTQGSAVGLSSDVVRLHEQILDGAFGRMTIKQHAAYQLVMAGKSNREIADVLHVSESTAKTYVYRLMKHFEVNNRAQLMLKTKSHWDALDAGKYQSIAGLRKDWANSIREDEPVLGMLRSRRGDDE